MKRIMFVLFVALLAIVPAVAQAQDSPGVAIGNDTVDLITVFHQTTTQTSFWGYAVTSGDQPAISHVTFAIGECFTIRDAGTWAGPLPLGIFQRQSGDGQPVVGLDSTTGLTGVKFNEAFSANETRYYYFEVNAFQPDQGDIVVATKAGPNQAFDAGFINGPVCDGSLDVSVAYVSVNTDGSNVSFYWETFTESGNTGWNWYAGEHCSRLLNDEPIPGAGDSVVPLAYHYEAHNNAEHYCLMSIDEYGYEVHERTVTVGVPVGQSMLMEPALFIPMVGAW